MIKKIISHPLFSGSFVMFVGGMATNVLSFTYHFVMGRLLSVGEYGILASIFSILYLIAIVPISSSFAIVKFISEAKDNKERANIYVTIRQFVWKLAISSSLLTVFISPLIAWFLHVKDIVNIIFVGPMLFFSLIILVEQASMQGILRFRGVVIPNFVSAFLKLAFGVIFVLLGFSVSGAMGGMLLGLLITYIVTVKLKGNTFSSKKIKANFEIVRFLKYALPVLIQALAFTAIFSVDIMLARHFLPEFEAGLFASLSMLGKIVYFAAQPITATMFPIVVGNRSRGEKYRLIFIVSFIATASISGIIVLFYKFFPEIAIGTLYGQKYLAASRELVWMGMFIGVYTTCYILVNFLLSVNRTKIVLLPLLAVIAQVVGIWFFHGSILQIIQISLTSVSVLLVFLILYLIFSQMQKRRVKVYGGK